MKTIGIIGAGNMGSAIASRIRHKYRVLICDSDTSKLTQLKRKYKIPAKSLGELVKASQVIILAVKPQDFDTVLAEVKAHLDSSKLVVSIAAGITTLYIEKRLSGKTRVIRTMPNMPAQIGEGITAVARGQYATPADVKLTGQIFNYVGQAVVVKEEMIDAITAVSGSGPAYVFLFVECLLKAARAVGLDEKLARPLAMQTLLGSAHLLAQSPDDAPTLRAKVTSKGGTTQAAMDVFFDRKIDVIFVEALAAAKRRAKELSK